MSPFLPASWRRRSPPATASPADVLPAGLRVPPTLTRTRNDGGSARSCCKSGDSTLPQPEYRRRALFRFEAQTRESRAPTVYESSLASVLRLEERRFG